MAQVLPECCEIMISMYWRSIALIVQRVDHEENLIRLMRKMLRERSSLDEPLRFPKSSRARLRQCELYQLHVAVPSELKSNLVYGA
ncbi:hypothetical protein MB84_26025 [Pandoraea oxalativorans]|uniref:Uncharacterized protein n=1 Tax=Pandoraea oxalativorans TaxID=573737 RepID=A0A0G3IBE3_9BURK|nr:hypothetical protein MB84_26025 [Pandoraea oxalativorans]